MIEYRDNEIHVASASGRWSSMHPADMFGGPRTLWIGDDLVIQDDGIYIDDMVAESAVIEHVRGHQEATGDRIESRAHFPFGGRIGLAQKSVYSGNHVSVNFDINWPRGAVVKRHFGVQRLTLPGPWKRFYVIPPVSQWCSGTEPAWHQVRERDEAGSGMLAHWHRPPLALVFERPNGTQLEIGTGSDVWRWEQALEAGEERGSYKILSDGGSLQVVREPLMTCDEFTPPARQFKLKWYLAWAAAGEYGAPAAPEDVVALGVAQDRRIKWTTSLSEAPCIGLDFASLPWPESALRSSSPGDYIRGNRAVMPCWEANATRKLARSVIRQLREKRAGGQLVVTGLHPGPCWDGSHVNRPHKDGVAHWDMSSLLAFCDWSRRALGDSWGITLKTQSTEVLPSLRGLFYGLEY